jgi:hypothetical protein
LATPTYRDLVVGQYPTTTTLIAPIPEPRLLLLLASGIVFAAQGRR